MKNKEKNITLEIVVSHAILAVQGNRVYDAVKA